MQTRQALVLLLTWIILPIVGSAQPVCQAPVISDQQVKDIVEKERGARGDLPKAFPKHRWIVRRQGCHYVYLEYGLPETPENVQIFKLNQHSVIVDVQVGGEPVKSFKCPGKVLTESALTEIIKKERGSRRDLPPEFSTYKTRVERLGCIYFYFEYAVPETRGNYHVFTIDPLGELMEFFRAKPY